MANNPLIGAWERVSDASEGILIYTGSHYAAVMASKERKRPAADQVSSVEALESLLTCQALAGTYSISGSTITHIRLANARENYSDRPAVFDYNIDGDTLTHTTVGGSASMNPGASLTYRRISDSGIDGPPVGAWELVDDIEQGVFVFTGTHYAVVRKHKERDLPKGAEYTPEEALTAIATCGAMSGTYTRSGTTLTMERTANLRPQATGVTAVVEAIIEGETMRLRTVSGVSANDQPWRRVS